jgi:hypothetical protein
VTGVPGGSPVVAGLVLLVVLLVGVAAGRATRRWSLLFAGLLAVVVLGIVTTGVIGAAGAGLASAAGITAVYAVAVPLVVAFVAGWLCGRGTWFRRLVVFGVAALLLAVFPYDVAGRATADVLLDPAAGAAATSIVPWRQPRG